jgi:CBS domain-containing protein/anti-sigma regulatory factor (Ser/Thr protein kinase)
MKYEISPLKVKELAYELKIISAMSDNLITVSPHDSMSHVRKILREKLISGVPVVEDDKMVGIISIENFIECIIEGGINSKVEDNMTSNIKSVYSDEPLIHAISKFDKIGYGRFPVLDRDTNKLVGIITKGDIIKCLLKKLEIDYYQEESHKYSLENIFEDIKSDKTRVIIKHNIKGGDYRKAGEKSGILKKNLLRLGIHPEISRRIVIASCEAEMNIIIYTNGGSITASVEEDKIKINAIDHGPGIPDIEAALQPGFSTAPDWVREMGFGAGMGLPNIKNCTDELKIKSQSGKGTNLEFIVYMKDVINVN